MGRAARARDAISELLCDVDWSDPARGIFHEDGYVMWFRLEPDGIVDRIDVRPSPIFGLARIRALVSATELQGARIPRDGKPVLTVKLGGAKVPYVLGLSAQAEVELDIVLVVATTDVFAPTMRPSLKMQMSTAPWLMPLTTSSSVDALAGPV